MAEVVTIYTVRRDPYTAAAKNSAGYGSPEFEYAAESAGEAQRKAIDDCTWRDPKRHFRFNVIGSRVVVVGTEPTEQWVTAPDGEEFLAGACQGHSACPVDRHEHGCFADDGANCDHPEDHEPTEQEPRDV